MKVWNLYTLFRFNVTVVLWVGIREEKERNVRYRAFHLYIASDEVYNFARTRKSVKELEVGAGNICNACSSIGWYLFSLGRW